MVAPGLIIIRKEFVKNKTQTCLFNWFTHAALLLSGSFTAAFAFVCRCRTPKPCRWWPTPEPCKLSCRSNKDYRRCRQKHQALCPGWMASVFFFFFSVIYREDFWRLIPPFLISLMSGGVPGMPAAGVPGMPAAGVPGIPTAGVPSMPTENPASSPSNTGTSAAQQQLMQQMLQMFAGGGGGSATVHMFTPDSHMLNASYLKG